MKPANVVCPRSEATVAKWASVVDVLFCCGWEFPPGWNFSFYRKYSSSFFIFIVYFFSNHLAKYPSVPVPFFPNTNLPYRLLRSSAKPVKNKLF